MHLLAPTMVPTSLAEGGVGDEALSAPKPHAHRIFAILAEEVFAGLARAKGTVFALLQCRLNGAPCLRRQMPDAATLQGNG